MFDLKTLTLVIYDDKTNVITFMQEGNLIVVAEELKSFYFPFKHKYNIITGPALANMLNRLTEVILSARAKKVEQIFVVPLRGATKLLDPQDYSGLTRIYMGPIELYTIKYSNFSNPLLVRLLLKCYDDKSKLLYKYIKTRHD